MPEFEHRPRFLYVLERINSDDTDARWVTPYFILLMAFAITAFVAVLVAG